MTTKTLLPFPTTYLCEASSSSHTSSKRAYHSRVHAEAYVRIQLLLLSQTLGDLQKCKKIPLFSLIFLSWKI